MRFMVWLGVLLLAASVSRSLEEPPSGYLSEDERQQLLDLLDESEAMYLGALAGVSDDQWAFKPAADRWSVGECAEHVVRSNQELLSRMEAALAAATDPQWLEKTKGKSELLLRVMPNRNPGGVGGATAPMEIRPTGEIPRTELIRRFRELYGRLRQVLVDMDQPLKEHIEAHPFPIFDPLNAYQWALYVPLHTIRHTKQMIEVMETEGYPGS